MSLASQTPFLAILKSWASLSTVLYLSTIKSFNNHVSISKSCCYHIRALRHIRPSITKDVSKMIACLMVGCRSDYANSVFVGASTSVLHKLERIQNTLARVVTRQHGREQHVGDTSPPALAVNQMENQFQSRYTNI